MRDNLGRRAVHVRPGGMIAPELEFLAVIVDCTHRAQRRLFSLRRGARREDRARHDAGEEMPGLRDEADFYGQLVLADSVEQRLQLAEGELRIGAGGLEEDFELHRPMSKLQRLRCPVNLRARQCPLPSKSYPSVAK